MNKKIDFVLLILVFKQREKILEEIEIIVFYKELSYNIKNSQNSFESLSCVWFLDEK